MYYTHSALKVKQQMSEKIYLYYRGDEKTAITGGWNITGTGITKNTNHIAFSSLIRNSRRITTANNIVVGKFDRLFLKIYTTSLNSNWSFNFYKGNTNPLPALNFYDIIRKNRTVISQESVGIINTEVILEFYETVDVNDVISLVNNYGIWRIYEVWIEKYDF